MKKLIKQIVLIYCLFPVLGFAQQVNYSGIITDSKSGEYLISAHIFDAISNQGCISNEYGYYNLVLRKGDPIDLRYSFVGYEQRSFRLLANSDTIRNISLDPVSSLNEIVIFGRKRESVIHTPQMSRTEIPIRNIKMMPSLFGEPNLMKTLQLLPGVQSGSDGDSQIYVRGGSPDQNLILLDEVPLYHISHYGGIFSLFNTDAINSVNLIKGGFPAKYGGRLSSVLNIHLKEGNKQQFKGKVNIGLLSSGFLLEGPIVQSKSSYLISARRSMMDLYTGIIGLMGNGIKNGFGFYDINTKFNTSLSSKDHLYFSLYNGDDNIFSKVKENDQIPYNSNNSIKWGNTAISMRWNHIYNPRLFSNVTGIYSKYRLMNTSFSEFPGQFSSTSAYSSFIEDLSLKADFEFKPTNNHEIQFGFASTRHHFNPGIFTYLSNENGVVQADSSMGSNRLVAYELNAYASEEFRWRRFSGNIGLHYSNYYQGEKSFNSIEPRVNFSYALYSNGTIKTSFARMQQYVHLLTNSGIGLPTDLWVPATGVAAPEKSDQLALGWAHLFEKQDIELSIEGYYKNMDNLIEYKEGTSFYSGTDWQEKIEVRGQGKAIGMELFIQKQSGNNSGWFGYTWSRNRRQFENINNGNPYYFRYDRPHEIDFLYTRKLSKGLNFSLAWVYKRGNPITLPSGKYEYSSVRPGLGVDENPTTIHIYPGRNQFRMRDYHRLDVSLSYKIERKRYTENWSFGIINLYNRMNPSYYKISPKMDGSLRLLQVTEFPFLPSISYSISF
ncbi:MAG: TonB-dependent receptor plug domain-containing protein [Bacteroidetes bacterium]|nr:TonB-dependent receptor plug domain-containing protein [Bacteroidota bacterium]